MFTCARAAVRRQQEIARSTEIAARNERIGLVERYIRSGYLIKTYGINGDNCFREFWVGGVLLGNDKGSDYPSDFLMAKLALSLQAVGMRELPPPETIDRETIDRRRAYVIQMRRGRGEKV
jgi:hypothetical protein